jgi:hypothetical protein
LQIGAGRLMAAARLPDIEMLLRYHIN